MRVLIAIGCNQYDYADPLNGAENDAQRIYEALIKPSIGDYDLAHSHLLLSPSLDEVRNALKKVFLLSQNIDAFTFFFAGHGKVSGGSFYMAVRDSSPDALSVSALSLGDLFRSLNEKLPVQSNIVIDACESGGLITDLSVLLKSNVIGNAGTPGVTLFASAAQDQVAGETSEGGFGTIAILNCIEGKTFVQDNTAVLDLIEIGRTISNDFNNTGQSPVLWGLNLYGPPGFCRNPRFQTDPSTSLRDLVKSWPIENNLDLKQHYDSLWQTFASLNGDWDPREFSNVLSGIFEPFKSNPDFLANFALRYSFAALDRARLSKDPYRKAEVAAALAVSLLPYLENPAVKNASEQFLQLCVTALLEAGRSLVDDLQHDKYALLSQTVGGISDLYYLPIRISKVLGWSAAAIEICAEDSLAYVSAEESFDELVALMLELYGPSIVAVSDIQAPYLSLIFSRCYLRGLKDNGEQLLGRYFHSLIVNRAKLARCDLPSDKALDYLLCTAKSDYSRCLELIERPIDTLTVLLRASCLFEMDEILDESLWKIDGVSCSAYLSTDFSQYGAELMLGGKNLTWGIGFDVFRVRDLVNSWPADAPIPKGHLTRATVVLSTILFPDRTAWFLLNTADGAAIQPTLPLITA